MGNDLRDKKKWGIFIFNLSNISVIIVAYESWCSAAAWCTENKDL
jgi:hypothetical protein